MVTLRQLLIHAQISQYQYLLWLGADCVWKPPHLFLNMDAGERASVDRLWGAKMRELVPDLQILAKPREAPVVKPKPVTERLSMIKNKAWRQQLLNDE